MTSSQERLFGGGEFIHQAAAAAVAAAAADEVVSDVRLYNKWTKGLICAEKERRGQKKALQIKKDKQLRSKIQLIHSNIDKVSTFSWIALHIRHG